MSEEAIAEAVVTFREAIVDDDDAIAALMAQLGYPNDPVDIRQRIATSADRSDDQQVVAICDDSVVGMVSIHLIPLFHASGSVARITSLVVSKDHRRRGIGRALLEHVEQFAIKHRCARIEVTSGDHRDGAHAFYKEYGFKPDERRFIKHLATLGAT